jgi:hypothetical protein
MEVPLMQTKINLMTIKWGDKFAAEYPNLIHRMAKRHMPCEFNSYCMTDDPTGLDKDIIPVECTEKWLWDDILSMKQWWFWDAIKMSLFAPKLCGIEGKILFSDLDNLFLNKLDRVVQTTPPAMISTNWNPNYFLTMGFNASLIYVDNRSPVTKEIWDHFVKHYDRAKGSLYSSDAYLWRCHRDKINTYPESTVYSHSRGAKYPDQQKGKYRSDHEVCIFMEDHEPDPLDIKKGWEADLCNLYL